MELKFKGQRHTYRERGVQGQSPDPTADEITARCEQIQATWSEAEKRLRRNFQVVANPTYGTTLRRGTNADLEEFAVPEVSVRELEEAGGFIGIESDAKHFVTAVERATEEAKIAKFTEPAPAIQRSFT